MKMQINVDIGVLGAKITFQGIEPETSVLEYLVKDGHNAQAINGMLLALGEGIKALSEMEVEFGARFVTDEKNAKPGDISYDS